MYTNVSFWGSTTMSCESRGERTVHRDWLDSVMHDNRNLERKGWNRQLKGGVNGPITFRVMGALGDNEI